MALVLTRQNLPTFDRAVVNPALGVAKGAYTLFDGQNGQPDIILIGTGSEVATCMDARELLAAEGIHARVVSMPSFELFEQQSAEYKEACSRPR